MKSLSDFTPRLPQSFLIVGSPGTAKTTLALQLPKPFILDCDDNLSGPVRYLKSLNKLNGPVFFDTPLRLADGKPCPREQQYDRSIALLKEACESPQVETLILDTLTSFTEMMFTKTLIVNGKKLGDNVRTFDPKFEYAEWHTFLKIFTQTIYWLKSSGKRICLTAHIEVDKDELTGTLFKFLKCPGQFRNTISGLFEEVWECYIESTGAGSTAKAVRKVRTSPDARSIHLGLKSAAGLGATFDADMDTIINKLSPA